MRNTHYEWYVVIIISDALACKHQCHVTTGGTNFNSDLIYNIYYALEMYIQNLVLYKVTTDNNLC